MKPITRIALGIDPGIANTGWAVVFRSITDGLFRLCGSGVVTTQSDKAIGSRLATIIDGIKPGLIVADVIGVELVFFGRNVSSAMSTAHVIGAVELVAHQAGIECLQILPNQVKAAVLGKSRGSKALVRHFVNKLLNADIKNDHEADACAAAIAVLLAQKEKRCITAK